MIDVIPNATSRDEMGRAKVNDLFSFFVGKYGPPESTAFQKARMKFVQSMAAYSLLCYIIQIKDRHNGNIMIDGEGHITHIGELLFSLYCPTPWNPWNNVLTWSTYTTDFGFLFDIDK